MSSEYLNKTEEQQFEEAKNWFKENSTPILLAIFVFATASFGWNFWKSHQAESAIQASTSYQATMEAYEQDPVKNQPLVAKFLEEAKGTNYAIFMQLEDAKNAVAKGDFAAAKSQLQAALNEVKDPSLQAIIRFRLAAVDFQLKEFDSALANLEQIKDQAWDARKQLFVADLLSAKGDKEAAKSAYEQIKANTSGQEREIIELKINNL
ncbi:MAG: tetratricopeptide repeat protein [Haemophilus parahaemolyticus]|uniref:Ancillary SecYEG translocon subunit n=1 Tax=Haemophilus parahaemolyticus TaxID=735 RepID=A0A369Z608_HAEPH|nr:tetratricopeptide repeat protein [Haemophilus parahaemolyticus]MDQ6573973.1 tetratricopeptide repeat protein [Haemophilus parahaemolyticus]MDQ6577124.1 tetratricopeptide repeat protein [Haemophilus parahaemolyticus]RDF00761.1 hypothetical protein DPV98_09330 [Haemophilus parahaemolyticus]